MLLPQTSLVFPPTIFSFPFKVFFAKLMNFWCIPNSCNVVIIASTINWSILMFTMHFFSSFSINTRSILLMMRTSSKLQVPLYIYFLLKYVLLISMFFFSAKSINNWPFSVIFTCCLYNPIVGLYISSRSILVFASALLSDHILGFYHTSDLSYYSTPRLLITSESACIFIWYFSLNWSTFCSLLAYTLKLLPLALYLQ